jgi:hypothetical protein
MMNKDHPLLRLKASMLPLVSSTTKKVPATIEGKNRQVASTTNLFPNYSK